MFAILLIALCVVTAHAQYSGYYSCPPDSLSARQFRMMIGDLDSQEIPTVDQAKRDLTRAPREIRDLASSSVSEALSYKKQFELLVRPFVRRCCDKPLYNCSHVDIPMRFIWYRYSYYYYYYNYFCFVIYPAGEKTIHYTKCTCMTCLRDNCCPVAGRCVETDYTYHYIIVYCPKLYYSYRYKILLVAVPKACKCMTYCPNNYYGYSRYSLGSTARSAAAPQQAAPQQAAAQSAAEPRPATAVEGADGEVGPSEIPAQGDQESPAPAE